MKAFTYTINAGGRLLDLSEPKVMGILNATPDSFFAGSRRQTEAEIADRANEIVEQGGEIIDVGAFSTRPGAAEVSIENGDITLTGDIDMSLDATLDITGVPSQTRFEINNTFSLDTFRPVKASGRFNPSINLNSLGNIEITGIPEFLTDGDVRADLDNPRIMVSIDNTMNATGLVSGTIIATKDGHESAKVTVPQMTVHPATTTHICICRKKTAEIEAEYGSNAYEVPNLSTLIEKIPDNISFDAKAMADKDRESEFMLDHTYTIKPSYTVEAPIAFAENASIVYKDSLDGWHEDLEDYDLSDDAAVCTAVPTIF